MVVSARFSAPVGVGQLSEHSFQPFRPALAQLVGIGGAVLKLAITSGG